MTETQTALETELKTYHDALPDLLVNAGKFVVIHGQEVGVYESYADAIKIGYEKYGLEPFLVKKISSSEQISYFTRDILPPCQMSTLNCNH